jgi:glycosyltransferase involved in cell wall biosynthesis
MSPPTSISNLGDMSISSRILGDDVRDSRLPVPHSCLVTCFPGASGHGRVATEISHLGLLESFLMFKIRSKDSEAGFQRVVKARFNPKGLAVFTSLHFGSVWSQEIRRYSAGHLCSPHFFHLVRYNPNLTGIVHDMGYLTPRVPNRSPLGYRYLFSKEIGLASRLKGIVTVSETTRQQLVAVNPDLRPTVIHNWTDDVFQPRDKLLARRRLGLPDGERILLSVGLDLPWKNLDLLPRLSNRLGPRYLVVRIGESKRIARAFPPGQFLSVPFVPEGAYPLYFNAADLLLFPSREEGFGVPLIEAINSRTPVVASDIPVFREILGRYEFLAPADDLDRWAELVTSAFQIASDPDRSKALYQSLGDHYRAQRARQEYLEFFRDVGFVS